MDERPAVIPKVITDISKWVLNTRYRNCATYSINQNDCLSVNQISKSCQTHVKCCYLCRNTAWSIPREGFLLASHLTPKRVPSAEPYRPTIFNLITNSEACRTPAASRLKSFVAVSIKDHDILSYLPHSRQCFPLSKPFSSSFLWPNVTLTASIVEMKPRSKSYRPPSSP